MKNIITLNLGLLSNKECDGLTEEQIIKGFKGSLTLFDMKLIKGKISQSQTEKTIVAQLEVLSYSNINYFIGKMCEYLEQDAIAFKTNEKGFLIYNNGFNAEQLETKKMQWGDFNQDYFIEL